MATVAQVGSQAASQANDNLTKGDAPLKDLYEIGEIPRSAMCRRRCMPGRSGRTGTARQKKP